MLKQAITVKGKAEIANVDSMDRRVTMTLKQVGESAAADQLKSLEREAAAASRGGTLGDLLKEHLGSLSAKDAGSSEAGDAKAGSDTQAAEDSEDDS